MSRVRLLLLATMLVLATMALLSGCRSAHTTSAILYIDEQRYDKAVAVLQEGFQFQDDEADAYYYLGEAYSHLAEEAVENDDFEEAQKNYELAYESYQRSLEIDREDWLDMVSDSLKYNYGNRYRQAALDWEGEYYEQAEGHLRLAYAALPDSLAPVKNIARMKMQMSEQPEYEDQKVALLEEALTLIDQALAENPEAYKLQVNKANVLDALDRNDEARQIFDSLLAEHGEDTGLLLDVAELALDDGDYARTADFYVMVVDINEGDTDASNDGQNKEMLLAAGSFYSNSAIGRYDDASAVLDRAANLEIVPTERTMLLRLKTFNKHGKKFKDDAAAETDPVLKAELDRQSKEKYNRAVEIGIAMTNNFVASAEGFLNLSMAQLEIGDFAASDANFKTYQELTGEIGN